MNINIIDMINMQKELDKNIEEKHNLKMEDLLNKRKLALIVEINEMINVTRCFKFWSLKKDYDSKVLGEEFVDCLHFIFSISNTYGLNKYQFDVKEILMDNNQLTDHILNLIKKVLNIRNSNHCEEIIYDLFLMIKSFGWSFDDVVNFYKEKNRINFERQKNNY